MGKLHSKSQLCWSTTQASGSCRPRDVLHVSHRWGCTRLWLNHSQNPSGILEQSPDIVYRLLLPLGNSSWPATGLYNRDWMLTNGPSKDMRLNCSSRTGNYLIYEGRYTALLKNSLSLLIVTDRNLGNKYGDGIRIMMERIRSWIRPLHLGCNTTLLLGPSNCRSGDASGLHNYKLHL